MNWGTKITIAATSFVLFILFMVYKASTQEFELVADDYYAQELAYQEVIDNRQNTNLLSAQPEWQVTRNQITLQLPSDFQDEPIEGDLYIFRPSNEELDQHIPLAPDASLKQLIHTHDWQAGYYKVKFNWKDTERSYYQEQDLFIE